MSVFNIDFECLSEAIGSYESLITNMENCSSSLISATSNINEEAYSGDDANVLRNNWSIQSGQVMPSAINQINFAKNALVDAREEFAACKRYCNNFGNVFGLNTSTGLWIQGRLKCDYDSLNEALDYCKKIEIGCKDIVDNTSATKREFIGLHNSYNNIYSRIDGFQTKVNDIGGSISVHGSDLGAYGAMVADADDRLNSKFKELLFSNLDFAKEYMLSSPDAYVAGTKIGLRGLVDKASLIDKALIKGYKAKFVSIDAAGNVIYDYSAIEQALNRCSTMDEYEFAALLSVFDDMGVCYGTNPYPGDIAYQIEQNLRAQMNIQVIGSDGFYNTPYDNLTYEQRAIYVMAYGDLYPEHMQKMDRLLSNMPTGTTTDVDGNPHSYEEDYYNICFLSFTGEEPEKTVFFKYIDEIVVEDWEYQGNDYWGRDYYVDPKSVHYTLSGYVNDNGYPVKTGANDPRGPYVIFFHEIGHAIDDLMADGIAGFSYKSEQVGLSDVIIECVKQDAMSRLNTISNLNDDEKIDIVELFVGPKINPDNLKYNSWNSNVQQAYNDLIDSYYTGQLNWSNLNVYSYECLTDVYFGCIDNKVEFGKYIMHRDDYYWYSKYGGDMLESIGREFDAEMFSYGMTHSPYNQINSVVYDMNLGEPEPGIFYDAYEAYNKMMEEEANKS